MFSFSKQPKKLDRLQPKRLDRFKQGQLYRTLTPYRTYNGAFAFDREYSWRVPKSMLELKRLVTDYSMRFVSPREFQFEEGDFVMYLEYRHVSEDTIACKFILGDRVISAVLLTYDLDFLEPAMPEKKDV